MVKLADFGASVQDLSYNDVNTIGTPAFMAPEICTNNPVIPIEYLPEIDIFAMGATLYNLVVGRPPWMGSSVFDLASKIRNIELTFPDDIIDPHLKVLSISGYLSCIVLELRVCYLFFCSIYFGVCWIKIIVLA